MPRKRLFPPTDPATGQRLHSKGRADYTILTANGRVTLSRLRYECPQGGYLTPLDALLDAAEQTITPAVREMACRLNQAGRSFDKTAENLARTAQIHLSGETLRTVVEAEGRAVQKAQKSGALLIGWTAADCRIEPLPAGTPAPVPARVGPADATVAAAGPASGGGDTAADAGGASGQPSRPAVTRVYLGSDGVKVPLVTDAEKQVRRQKIKEKRRRCGKQRRPLPKAKVGADQRYKEFKIVTFYDQTQKHRHVAVTQGDHEEAGKIMRRDAGRIGLDQADDKVAVVDGAPWIRNQIQGQSLPVDVIELDFWHLADNVHKARRAVYGEEAEAGKEWAAGTLHVAKHEGYAALRDRLVQWKGGVRGEKKRKAAEDLIGYVTDRREMVEYPEYEAAGRQIGSGPTESMCKTTTTRLKGVGMRWEGGNAEAVMALDALEQSGEWKRYWDMRLKRPA